jgi:hypothetical protein
VTPALLTDEPVVVLAGQDGPRSSRRQGWLYADPDAYRRWVERRQRYRPPAAPGLRYFRHHHDYKPDEAYRRTHPQTYRGQFGEPGDPPRLTLRHYSGPGRSPFGLDAHRPYSETEALPEFVPPGAETPAQEHGRDTSAPPPDRTPTVRHEASRAAPRRATPPPASARTYVRARRDFAHHASARRANEHAWTLLSGGQAEKAQYRFSSLALSQPSDMTSRAGYAIASALHGHHGRAIWAMRRAFRIDPSPLSGLPVDAGLETRIHTLLDEYMQPKAPDVHMVDAMFMRASLYFILNDVERAEAEIRKALQHGDRDYSALRLLDQLFPMRDVDYPGHTAPDYRVARPDLVAAETTADDRNGG